MPLNYKNLPPPTGISHHPSGSNAACQNLLPPSRSVVPVWISQYRSKSAQANLIQSNMPNMP
ncbi:hypothetical protein L484_015966 [Morus notabilis]|uniref:Uncharacterized protein n=1 Tax=Morus notabilis TaxID=981085 RepID=W9QYR6_9ROSA|nr:hypothetical protein L484_015966 [Morus notabilis]